MKNHILSLMLALILLTVFAGCGTGSAIPVPSQDNPADAPNLIPADAPETEPDYSRFTFPEETDKLVIWSDGTEADTPKAVSVFRERYPDVDLVWEQYDQDEYKLLLQTELAAGRGPDIIYGKPNDLPDIYKTMKTKIFEDLAPWLANDENLDLSVFQNSVLSGGQMDGKQYILPVKVQLPVYLTTEEFLAECGADAETLSTYDGFMELALALRGRMPNTHLLFWGVLQGADVVYPRELYLDLGFQLIDYGAGTVDVDAERFRQLAELCRTWYDKGPGDWAPLSVEALTNRVCLLFNFGADKPSFLSDGVTLRQLGETPVYAVTPDQYDGVTAQILRYGAIPSGAENKANAWRFLKTLLSEEVLIDNDAPMSFGLPVRNDCLRALLDRILIQNPDGVTEVECDAYYAAAQRVTRAVMLPPVLLTYIRDSMEPYWLGKAGFDDCFADLLNVLEIYKDE